MRREGGRKARGTGRVLRALTRTDLHGCEQGRVTLHRVPKGDIREIYGRYRGDMGGALRCIAYRRARRPAAAVPAAAAAAAAAAAVPAAAAAAPPRAISLRPRAISSSGESNSRSWGALRVRRSYPSSKA